MIRKNIASFFVGMLVSASLIPALFYLWSFQKMTKVHELEYPLVLATDSSSNSVSLLPKGTTLYFDKSYPEGFTRYKVYINVDRMPLKLTELADPTTIIPIDAYAPEKDVLQKSLRDLPLTKKDLEGILKSPYLSKTDVREVLEDYLKK
jgi:hypothetical protein